MGSSATTNTSSRQKRLPLNASARCSISWPGGAEPISCHVMVDCLRTMYARVTSLGFPSSSGTMWICSAGFAVPWYGGDPGLRALVAPKSDHCNLPVLPLLLRDTHINVPEEVHLCPIEIWYRTSCNFGPCGIGVSAIMKSCRCQPLTTL